jgi:hypothetical protein
MPIDEPGLAAALEVIFDDLTPKTAADAALAVADAVNANHTDPSSGTTDHAALSHLDYASAGHTGFVPATRTVNGHALSANVTVTASDVGADPTGTAAGLVATEASTRAAADTAEASARVSGDAASVATAAADATTKANAAQAAAIAASQPVDTDLTAIANLATTGLVARTGSGTAAARTLTAGSAQLTVTNGDGVSGNPTVDLAYASAVRESGDPTTLTIGAVADGQVLKRVGSTVVGVFVVVPFVVGSFYDWPKSATTDTNRDPTIAVNVVIT